MGLLVASVADGFVPYTLTHTLAVDVLWTIEGHALEVSSTHQEPSPATEHMTVARPPSPMDPLVTYSCLLLGGSAMSEISSYTDQGSIPHQMI